VPKKKWLLQADLSTGQVKREKVIGKFVAADGTVCSLMENEDLAVVGAYQYFIIHRDN